MKNVIVSNLIAVFLLAGCAGPTVNVARLQGESFPAVPANRVQVTTAANTSRQYREIGIIDVEEGPGSQTYEEMLAAMRERAGEMGADAVIVQTATRQQGLVPVGGVLMAVKAKVVKGLAIRWVD